MLAIQTSFSDLCVDKISSSSNIIEDLNFNSYQFIELIVNIENELHISFDDEDLDIDKFENLATFVKLLMEKYLSR